MKSRSRRRALGALGALPLWMLGHAARAQGAGDAFAVPRALGYLPWWMARGLHALSWQAFDRLALFDAAVQPDGSVFARDWPEHLAAIRERSGLAIDLALTILNEREFERLFANAAARERLLRAALRWCEAPGLAGLQLDFEGYGAAHPDAVAGFREWLEALDAARRRVGKTLSVFYAADDAFAPYDGVAAKRIDYWVAQIYDAHWSGSKVTGPLVTRAPANQVAVPRALGRLAALGVERRRVLLSVPLYGWEWPSESAAPGAAVRGAARLLTFAETPQALMPNDRRVATELAKRHGVRRDGEHTPYYAYRDGSGWIQGWYEDSASLSQKLAPEREQGYAGLAFFAMGYDKGELVDAMLRWWRPAQR